MRLSFNEIRARASRFAADYADATYEKGETQTFYNDFFQIFGVQRRSVARYEEHVKKLNNKTGFIDLFGVVCGRGRNPTLRLWPTIFSGKIDVFPGDRRSRLISSMTSVAPA